MDGGDPFEVRSASGTSIAVFADGTGPSIVMAHGALSDHTADLPFVAELRNRVTTFGIDRRGRGARG